MYRTGDLGRWRYDETLQCLGRLDNQVKVRGFRIELEEIEAVLLQQRGVREAAVAVRGFAGDRQLVGYITGDRLNIDQLSATLRGRLPKYMVPAEWMELKSLPRLPNGKLNRRLLPQPVLKIRNVSELPRTSIEKKLAEIWSDLLHIERIDRYDDFFGLGGHSLLATRMVSRIRASLNVSVPLQLVFQTTVLRDLSEQVEKLNDSNPEQIQLRRGIRNTPTPLSPAQQRFWLLQQLAPESAAYNVPFVAKISGKFDRETFSRSLNTVVNHHEVLRSKYVVIDGVPQQIPCPAGVADLVFMNLEYLGEKRDEGAQKTLEERARRIFDLSKKPPLQVTLLQLDRNTHWLLVTMHHIITDGWSIGLFVRELFHQYSDLLAGSESVAPPPRLQYSDVAAWQRQLVESGALEPELQYWERQLADLPPVLDLPRDMPNRAVHSFSAAVHPIEFSSQYSGALIEFCRSHGFTPYVTMLAAFFLLMAKVAGQEDITVGSPIVNRDKLELEEVIGCLINTVVLRVRLKEGLSIAKLLTTVRQTVLDALRNQHIPFEQVIRRLRPLRGLDREQLFQIMFGLQDMPFQTSSIGEATVAPVRFTPLLLRGEVVDKCDLRFQLLQSAEGFGGFCEYNTQVFHESTIMWIVGAYLQVLEQIMSESYQWNPVDDIRIERTITNPAAR